MAWLDGPGVARLLPIAQEPYGQQTEIPAFAGMTQWWGGEC
jgi:hypothetical protein